MTDTAESLIAEIRYQYPLGVTTWGPCETGGCDGTARGSRRCVNCLTDDLADIVGPVARQFHRDTARAHRRACKILRLAEGGK